MTAAADFTQLYTEHYAAVLLRMRAYLPLLDAEDAAQETFVRAWAYWPPKHGEVTPWLFAVARSVLVDTMRRRAVVRPHLALTEYDMPLEADGFFLADGPEEAVVEDMARAEQWQRIERVWPSLPPRQQHALLLWMDSTPHRQAARALGTTRGGYRATLLRGQWTLKRMAQP